MATGITVAAGGQISGTSSTFDVSVGSWVAVTNVAAGQPAQSTTNPDTGAGDLLFTAAVNGVCSVASSAGAGGSGHFPCVEGDIIRPDARFRAVGTGRGGSRLDIAFYNVSNALISPQQNGTTGGGGSVTPTTTGYTSVGQDFTAPAGAVGYRILCECSNSGTLAGEGLRVDNVTITRTTTAGLPGIGSGFGFAGRYATVSATSVGVGIGAPVSATGAVSVVSAAAPGVGIGGGAAGSVGSSPVVVDVAGAIGSGIGGRATGQGGADISGGGIPYDILTYDVLDYDLHVTTAVERWRFLLLQPDGTPIGDLTDASQRKVTFRLSDPSEASFSISGRSRQAALIEELATDILVMRGKKQMLRTRVITSADSIDEEAHTVSVGAVDYRSVLGRRILTAPTVFASTEQADIAWSLIAATQSTTGGNLGITRGSGQTTGVLRYRTFDPGQKVGELLANLGAVINGFDWEIDPTLSFNVFYPQRGTERSFLLRYGSTVAKVTRTVDSGSYANVVRQSGADTTTPVLVAVDDLATRPEGQWDTQVGSTDLLDQATVADKATAALAEASVITPSYNLTLAPGVWDPSQLWLGDTARVLIRSGRLNVDAPYRVLAITVSIDDDGRETVEVAVGRLPLDQARRLRAYASRLDRLERN